MAPGEAEAIAKKERTLATRCKKYGITPEFYNRLGEAQGWRCAVCGRHQSEFKISLAIDHEHFRIIINRYPPGGWYATAVFEGRVLADAIGKTKVATIQQARAAALPKSVRGLLCPGRYGKTGQCCNRIMGRIDSPAWLEKVLAYLRYPPAHKILKLTDKESTRVAEVA